MLSERETSRPPQLIGSRVILRPPLPEDAASRAVLGRNAEIALMFGVVLDQQESLPLEDAEAWVAQLSKHPQAWVISTPTCIGEIRLDHINLDDRRASMAIVIYSVNHLAKGLGSEAIRLVLHHAFGTLGLHRVSIRVLAYNARAIKAYEKCGFVVEGREREAALVEDKWHDDVMLGLLDRDYALL